MADIIYFGTNGESGHYPMGIDKTLSNDEYKMMKEIVVILSCFGKVLTQRTK